MLTLWKILSQRKGTSETPSKFCNQNKIIPSFEAKLPYLSITDESLQFYTLYLSSLLLFFTKLKTLLAN